MKRKVLNGKAIVASILALGLALQSVPYNVLASASDPDYTTVLEDDVDLIDGQPIGNEQHKHYYGGSYADGTPALPAADGRKNVAESYGQGKTTAYKFGWIREGSTGSFEGWKFDFNGLPDQYTKEATRENEEAFLISDKINGGNMSITYPSSDPQGFNTTIGFGVKDVTGASISNGQSGITVKGAELTQKLGTNRTLRTTANLGNKFYPSKDGEWRNGEVIKTFDGSTDLKLEVRLSVKPSADGKYILTEYTVHNSNMDKDSDNAKIVDANRRSSNGGDGGRTVWFSAGSDIMIAQHDGAPVWSTVKTGTGNKIEGIHGQSNNGGTNTLASFDLLTYHPQLKLGIQKRGDEDPSKLTTWIGQYSIFPQNLYHDLKDTSYMPNGTYSSLDSGLAYSMRFDLLPGETKTGTFAWSMKGPTYYVDPVNGKDDNDSTNNGHMGAPYKSIKKALEVIKSRTPRRVYINVMGDIELDETLDIPAEKDITISTTDYVKDTGANSKVAAYPIELDEHNVRSNQVSIKRKEGFNGDLFRLKKDPLKSDLENSRTALRLTDIKLDGNKENAPQNTGALINASAGTVDLQTGSILTNNQIHKIPETLTSDANGNGIYDDGDTYTDTNANGKWDNFAYAASAVELTGSANFTMTTGGVIKDNISYQGAAVMKDSTGKFEIGEGDSPSGFIIDNNVNITGQAANTQLNVQKTADGTVTGESNKITVAGNMSGYSRVGLGTLHPPVSQTVAIPVVNRPASRESVPFTITNFPVDKRPGQWTAADLREDLELSAAEYTYKVEYLREDTGATLYNSENAVNIVGKKIEAKPVDLTSQGYIYKGVDIIPAANHGLSVDSNGNIDGFMPSDNLSITYKYVKNAGIAKFFADGGTSSAEEIISTAGVAPTASMPTASRTGYIFDGWYEMTDTNNNGEYDAGTDTLSATKTTALDSPVVIGTKYYVAKWTVSPDTYVFTIKHKNNNTSLPITFKTETNAYTYTSAITAGPLNIPGYKRLAQSVDPNSVGSFDGNFDFAGHMPIGSVNLDYRYRVDTTQRFTFKVEHYDTQGREIQSPTVQNRTAETKVTAKPLTMLGYDISTKTITYGTTTTGVSTDTVKTIEDMARESGETVGFNNTDNTFTAYMPNQNITVRYTYAPSSDYYVVQKYVDADNNNERIGNVIPNPYNRGDSVSLPFAGRYGYTYRNASIDKTIGGQFDSTGNFTGGTMIGDNVNITYDMNRDPNFWKTITYSVANAPYNKGNISGTSTFTFLKNDGTAEGNANAHTFAKIKELGNEAVAVPSPSPYYKFDGWYLDPQGTQKVEDSKTFDGDVTVYAKFVEDPEFWVDINFAAKEHGQVNNTATTNPYHTWYDKTWSQISTDLPNTTPEVNYLFDKWTDGNVAMQDNTGLENHKTYYATFKKDPLVWGTEVGHFNPTGMIAENGKGKIRVTGVYKDNVYVVTDLEGKVIDVIKAPADGVINFKDLYPGTSYNVYEGVPSTVVNKGDDIANITGVSAPKKVVIPAVGTNYTVGYDTNNDGKVKIIVDPADPDSDYALIDEDGNVVPYDDSDNGWKHATDKTNPKVVFDNLEPNATYTVVARKKGDTTKTPHDKLPEGSQIIANPGDEFEVPKYIVETKGGKVETVGDTTVGASRYDQVKKGESVTIHAEPTNSDGSAFKYWKVMNGHNSAIIGNINTQDFTFNMEATNIVLKAVYERRVTNPSNAEVGEETRGGGIGEFGLDPNSVPSLEDELTTDKDRELIDINGANVTYKVIFNKRDASSAEKTLVKPESISGTEHADAFTAAWALDIFAERYVDGRLVDRATSSDAALNAVVQLNAKDIDMLDYQIFDVNTANGTATLVHPTYDPEQTAGLFEFSANLNHKYVLVYSKAFKVSFVDNNPVLDHLHFNDLSRNFYKRFKVRRNEGVAESYYNTDYSLVTAYANGATAGTLVTPFENIYGVQYDYVNWSTKDMPANIKVFDEDAGIKKNTVVFAYYNTNKPQVDKARVDLTDLIAEAEDFSDSPFIKVSSLNELKEAIAGAKAVLDKHRDDEAGNLRQANYAELQAAFDFLKQKLDVIRTDADTNRTAYIGRTGGNSSGGGGSVGKGKGTSAIPLQGEPEKNFMLGVNGTWKVNPLTGKYQYLVYGGMALNNTWGRILTTDASGKAVTNWYFFDDKSNMITGWYKDSKTKTWYYLNPQAGADNGKMLTSWFKTADGSVNNKEYWYFADSSSGVMYKGWVLIGDKWYYFAPTNMSDGRPEGSLYTNTTTPDGYKVNANGEWIQ